MATGSTTTTPTKGSARLEKFDWLWADARSRLGLGWIAFVILVAVIAPIIAPYDPIEQDLLNVLKGPSSSHWLGTDDIGRDFLSRLMYGTRSSMFGSFLAVAVALVIGIPVGVVAGYLGGLVDNLLMRVVDSVLGFPAIVLVIGLVAALGPSLRNGMIAVGVAFSPSIARLMRGQVLSTKKRLYVDAAVQFGSTTRRTILRHILPNAIQPIIVQAALLLAVAFLAEAALSFIGLATQPPTPSWGAMLNRSSQYLLVSPGIQIYMPGLAITLTVLAINSLGDSLRDSLDPVAGTERRIRLSIKRALKREGEA
ncbi:MAG: peptide/nickel transport system permease protein [Acidimicrobiales bacterium]|jgi:peptide/nickel transport system permease protein